MLLGLYRIWAPSWGYPTVDCKPHQDQSGSRSYGSICNRTLIVLSPPVPWHEVTNVGETTARFLVSLYCALSKPRLNRCQTAGLLGAISEARCATRPRFA